MKKMNTLLSVGMVVAFFAIAILPANATIIQIGDFRLNSNDYSGGYTYFDPGFGPNQTRGVVGAPVQIYSDFSGTSQNPGGGSPDSATDIGLQTWSSSTVIRQLNRYADSSRVGIVQWNFNLTPIDAYLTNNNLALTALDLDLVTDPSDAAKEYDVYLSYTNAAEGIALTDISPNNAVTNHDTFWSPSQTSTEGSVVGGTHKILELDHTGDLSLNESLLSLYNAGVRDVNLIMASNAYFASRTIGILEDSGLSIDTVAIPEPSSFILLALAGFGFVMTVRKRRGL